MIDLTGIHLLTDRELSLVRMTALKVVAQFAADRGADTTPLDLQMVDLELVSEPDQGLIEDVIADVFETAYA
jgi:hypothetical protein